MSIYSRRLNIHKFTLTLPDSCLACTILIHSNIFVAVQFWMCRSKKQSFLVYWKIRFVAGNVVCLDRGRFVGQRSSNTLWSQPLGRRENHKVHLLDIETSRFPWSWKVTEKMEFDFTTFNLISLKLATKERHLILNSLRLGPFRVQNHARLFKRLWAKSIFQSKVVIPCLDLEEMRRGLEWALKWSNGSNTLN